LDHYVAVLNSQHGMDTQPTRNMENKDIVANTTTMAGVFAYLMKFQGELTLLLLLTGLVINLIRIWDRFRKKNS